MMFSEKLKATASLLLLSAVLVSTTGAWSTHPTVTRSTATVASMGRRGWMQKIATASVAAAGLSVSILPAGAATTLPNGVTYEVKKTGSGPKPEVGELVAIRFAAYNGDIKIDDIFDTPEPYYTRVGSGGLLKGVEQTLPMMQVGDRWVLSIPGELAFGKKGRPASAGKPRIPGDATITFDVEMVGLPGREVELIELIGDV